MAAWLLQVSGRQRLISKVVLIVVAVVNVLALLKVEECNLILEVAHFVADCNAISGSENGVREDFAEERDFV